MTTEPIARLEVDRTAFLEELRRMTKLLGRRSAGDVVLIYDVGRLLIRLGGAEFAVPAIGHWMGEACASASMLRALAKVPPPQDPLVIQIKEGRLRIAGSSVPCRWQRPGEATIEVPINLGLRERIKLAHAYSPMELEKSGIATLVADARGEMEKRIAEAARQLAPLGVTPTDLRVLVVARLGVKE